MGQPVAHPNNSVPRHFRGALLDLFREVISGFSDDFNFSFNSQLGFSVSVEFLEGHTFNERRALIAGFNHVL
jgi:hypothetical protein